MDKKMRARYLIHLLGLSSILLVFLVFGLRIQLFHIILLIFIWEIIVNLAYPIDNTPRYYVANVLGLLIFMSIILFRQHGEIWFDWHWMLNYQGILFVLIAPLFGFGIRRMVTEKKHTIYLAHMLVPSMILLLVRIATNGSVPGGVLVIVVLIIIVWQVVGSTKMANSDFWKFYLANVIGLVLFIIIFNYEEFVMMSLPDWIKHNRGALVYILGIPMIGLGIGRIRNFKPIDDGQKVNQHEQSKPTKKE